MAKASPQTKLVNGEIADADVVNQIVENVGSQGGLIPYDPTTNNQETNGSQSIGSTAFPWGSLFVNRNANFVEVDLSTNTAASSIAMNLLRKFISLKDAPGNGIGTYVGNGGKFVQVNNGENGLQFANPTTQIIFTSSGTFVCPAGITKVYLSMVGGGASGNSVSGSSTGGGGGQSCVDHPFAVTPGNSYSVTIGAGGAAITGSSGHNDGGNTSFDALSVSGATGATGGGAPLNANAATPGGFGVPGGNGAIGSAGGGGGTLFGAGNGGTGTSNTGAGGAGNSSSGASGPGDSGLCIITY